MPTRAAVRAGLHGRDPKGCAAVARSPAQRPTRSRRGGGHTASARGEKTGDARGGRGVKVSAPKPQTRRESLRLKTRDAQAKRGAGPRARCERLLPLSTRRAIYSKMQRPCAPAKTDIDRDRLFQSQYTEPSTRIAANASILCPLRPSRQSCPRLAQQRPTSRTYARTATHACFNARPPSHTGWASSAPRIECVPQCVVFGRVQNLRVCVECVYSECVECVECVRARLVERDAERPDVDGGRDAALAADGVGVVASQLLRRRVGRRACAHERETARRARRSVRAGRARPGSGEREGSAKERCVADARQRRRRCSARRKDKVKRAEC
eukprot:6190630-Pleurochrysis_carterae.AAC.3